jgi:hypothetical protein
MDQFSINDFFSPNFTEPTRGAGDFLVQIPGAKLVAAV